MANGLKLKARIIEMGLKIWDVSKRADIHPSRLSGILNNRIDATFTEIAEIEAVISSAERQSERQDAGGQE